MAIIGGDLGYRILLKVGGSGANEKLGVATVYQNKSKTEVLLGKDIWRTIKDKVVIDFGCGIGSDAIEMARMGAKKVIGVDIQERALDKARIKAQESGVSELCEFAATPSEPADIIIALDSFEHFDDPAEILGTMRIMLKPGGCVLASFGPTWYHPYGGHLFSVFPWAHLIFSEKSLIKWRSTFKTDGARRFHEVAGGLNQMTIRRFKKLVEDSPFRFAGLELVPIRKLKWLAGPLTREFTTSIVRCKLIPRES